MSLFWVASGEHGLRGRPSIAMDVDVADTSVAWADAGRVWLLAFLRLAAGASMSTKVAWWDVWCG